MRAPFSIKVLSIKKWDWFCKKILLSTYLLQNISLGKQNTCKDIFLRLETVMEVFNCHWPQLICYDLNGSQVAIAELSSDFLEREIVTRSHLRRIGGAVVTQEYSFQLKICLFKESSETDISTLIEN